MSTITTTDIDPALPPPAVLARGCVERARRVVDRYRDQLAANGADLADCERLLRTATVVEANVNFFERIYLTLDDDYAARNADVIDRWQRLRSTVLERLASDPTGAPPRLGVTSLWVSRALAR